jgi:glycosyltransferase involved in cell wall biosynthesis
LRPVRFVIPGDLAARTGGYGYDRRLIEGLRARGVPVEHAALPGGFPFPDAAGLAAAERAFAETPDGSVLLADGLAFGVLGDVAARHGERIRIVALCHHPLALESGLDPEAAAELAAAERAALSHARAVIVTSPATARTLASEFGVPADRITVVLPGTDPAPPAACTGDPPVLLAVGSLIPRKGHDVLVAALGRLRDRAWTARFVGSLDLDPGWAAGIRAAVASEGLARRVALVGPVPDAAAEYAGADVFVLPSRHEGYGMAFAEALAHGLPVIAARAGAVADVVPPEAGILVPPDDAEALAAAIATLLDDKEIRARYRDGARRAGRRFPTWDDTAAAVAAVLAGLEGT